jgi:predicted MFS family arabinose efflux permease
MKHRDESPLSPSPASGAPALGGAEAGTGEARQLVLAAILVFGLMLPVTALVPVLQEVTGGRYAQISVFQKHLFMSVNMIGAFLFAPLAGLLSDVLMKRKLLIGAAFLINALTLLLMRFDWPYSIYLSLRFVEGCAHITSLSLLMTLAVDGCRTSRRGRAMGMVGAALTLGVATGAPLGGLIGQTRPLAVFLYGSLLMAILGILAFLLLRDVKRKEKPASAGAVLRSLGQQRLLAVPYTFTFIDRLTVGFIVSTMALYLRTEMQASPAQIGAIMALFLFPFSLLTYPSGRLSQRFNKLKMMLAGSFLYGLVLIAIGFATLPAIHWLMLAGGVAAALMFAPSLVLVSHLSDPGNRALAMSGFNTAGSLGFLLGPLLGGAVVTFFSTFTGFPPYSAAFVVAGALELACVLLFVSMIRRVP